MALRLATWRIIRPAYGPVKFALVLGGMLRGFIAHFFARQRIGAFDNSIVHRVIHLFPWFNSSSSDCEYPNLNEGSLSIPQGSG